MKKFIALIAFSFNFAQAGEMRTSIDNFTQETNTSYFSAHQNLMVFIFKRSEEQASIMAGAIDKITNCKRVPLMIKTKDDQIHRLETTELQNKACVANVSFELIKDGFAIRLPLYNNPHIDAVVDTSNMDWAAMGKRKVQK